MSLNSMILPLVPRGCRIISSTVEGKLFPRFYKEAKCLDVYNSVDCCHFSDYGNQVSTIIGTEILGVINRQWRSLQETRWNMPLLNVLTQIWWLWLWGTTGSPELCISCSWSHCQSKESKFVWIPVVLLDCLPQVHCSKGRGMRAENGDPIVQGSSQCCPRSLLARISCADSGLPFPRNKEKEWIQYWLVKPPGFQNEWEIQIWFFF